MVTGAEVALVRPVVDALIGLYKKAKGARLKSTAEAALAEAIRELLLAPQDLNSAKAKIAVAKAAGIINADMVLAEEMVTKHESWAGSYIPHPRPSSHPRPRPTAKKAPAKKAAAKKSPAKKAAKKSAAKKAPKKSTAKKAYKRLP
jgi:hypothetical protein